MKPPDEVIRRIRRQVVMATGISNAGASLRPAVSASQLLPGSGRVAQYAKQMLLASRIPGDFNTPEGIVACAGASTSLAGGVAQSKR